MADCEGTILSDRRTSRPWGLAGGSSATKGANSIINADGSIVPLAGKEHFKLIRGQHLRVQTPGGGGWGSN